MAVNIYANAIMRKSLGLSIRIERIFLCECMGITVDSYWCTDEWIHLFVANHPVMKSLIVNSEKTRFVCEIVETHITLFFSLVV